MWSFFRERFALRTPYALMSPVIFPKGFTRDYLDAKINHAELRTRIHHSFGAVHDDHDYTVVEGTGHSGVGSIIQLSNADVAAALDLEVILVSTGGVGAAFDQLALNRMMFESAGVKVRAIILNKVIPDKRGMVMEYLPKALQRWNIPLAGCIPYSQLLQSPSMFDFENLFQSPLISGEQHRYRHFFRERFVAQTHEQALHRATPNELIITHATRDDIILATIEDELKARREHPQGDLERGMILTGHTPPSQNVMERIKRSEMPVLFAPVSSYKAMEMISGFTAKIRREDVSKVEQAIKLVEEHIDFDVLCQ